MTASCLAVSHICTKVSGSINAYLYPTLVIPLLGLKPSLYILWKHSWIFSLIKEFVGSAPEQMTIGLAFERRMRVNTLSVMFTGCRYLLLCRNLFIHYQPPTSIRCIRERNLNFINFRWPWSPYSYWYILNILPPNSENNNLFNFNFISICRP